MQLTFTKMKPFKLYMVEYARQKPKTKDVIKTIKNGVKEIDKRGKLIINLYTSGSCGNIPYTEPIPNNISK